MPQKPFDEREQKRTAANPSPRNPDTDEREMADDAELDDDEEFDEEDSDPLDEDEDVEEE